MTDPMTPRDALAELRELSEKATPGEWSVRNPGGSPIHFTGSKADATLAVAAVNILRDPAYTLLSTEEYDRLRDLAAEYAVLPASQDGGTPDER